MTWPAPQVVKGPATKHLPVGVRWWWGGSRFCLEPKTLTHVSDDATAAGQTWPLLQVVKGLVTTHLPVGTRWRWEWSPRRTPTSCPSYRSDASCAAGGEGPGDEAPAGGQICLDPKTMTTPAADLTRPVPQVVKGPVTKHLPVGARWRRGWSRFRLGPKTSLENFWRRSPTRRPSCRSDPACAAGGEGPGDEAPAGGRRAPGLLPHRRRGRPAPWIRGRPAVAGRRARLCSGGHGARPAGHHLRGQVPPPGKCKCIVWGTCVDDLWWQAGAPVCVLGAMAHGQLDSTYVIKCPHRHMQVSCVGRWVGLTQDGRPMRL